MVSGKNWDRRPEDKHLGLTSMSRWSYEVCRDYLTVGSWVRRKNLSEVSDDDARRVLNQCVLNYLPWGVGDGETLCWQDDAAWIVLAATEPTTKTDKGATADSVRIVHVGTKETALEILTRYAPNTEEIVGYGRNAYRGGDFALKGLACATGKGGLALGNGPGCACVSTGFEGKATVTESGSVALTSNYGGEASAAEDSRAIATGAGSKAVGTGTCAVACAFGAQSKADAHGWRAVAIGTRDTSIVKADGLYSVAVATDGGWARAGESGAILLSRVVGDRVVCRALHVGIEAKRGHWYSINENGEVIEARGLEQHVEHAHRFCFGEEQKVPQKRTG